MADYADNLGVDKFLRHRGANLGIGLVVFLDQHELGVLAVDLDFRGVGFVDGEHGAVFVVLAQVGDATGERADVADLDFNRRRRRGRSRRGFGFFLAAGDQQQCGKGGGGYKTRAESGHGDSPGV